MQYSNFTWRDAQPFSETFDDIYYSSNADESVSGEGEFLHVFFKNNGLPCRWQENRDFVIAELGLGSTLNCLLTIQQWLAHLEESQHDKCLHYIAVEKYPLSPQAIVELLSRYSMLQDYCQELVDNYPPAVEGSHSRLLFNGRVHIHFKFMDAFDALKDEQLNVDAWYLDGFSPAKNADMWSAELFQKIALNSHKGTTCSTYTSAGFVKRNLQQSGFIVKKVTGHGNKREMLTAELDQDPVADYRFADKPWYCLPLKQQQASPQVTIIGAGIAGLSVAYTMVKRGCSVTVIDRSGKVAQQTSANPCAIVYPRLSVDNDVDTEFYTAAYCYSLYQLAALQKNQPDKFWFDDGLLQLMDRKRAGQILDKYAFNDDFVSQLNTFSADFMPEEKLLDGKVFLDYKKAGVVLPPLLCEVLKRECADRLTIKQASIDAIKKIDDKWHCYSANDLLDVSEVLVIANGIDVNALGLEVTFPLEKVRGQVAVLNETGPTKVIAKTVNTGKYITPAIAGKHYIGATYHRGVSSLLTDESDNVELLAAAEKSFPGTFSANNYSTAWVGIRSMSKDRVPVVGPVPDITFYKREYRDICHGNINKVYQPAQYLEGLYVSAAHGSRGFSSCFLSAEIIAAQIRGEPLPVSKKVADYLSPSRFIVNDLKRS